MHRRRVLFSLIRLEAGLLETSGILSLPGGRSRPQGAFAMTRTYYDKATPAPENFEVFTLSGDSDPPCW